jgi:hypothetical protein
MNPMDIINWCYYEAVRIEKEEESRIKFEAIYSAKSKHSNK